jgi:hypothetical protein
MYVGSIDMIFIISVKWSLLFMTPRALRLIGMYVEFTPARTMPFSLKPGTNERLLPFLAPSEPSFESERSTQLLPAS